MPFDKVVEIDAKGAIIAPPSGSSWRTFGSPIGAGKPKRGELADGPPWPADPDDSAGFRELHESPAVSMFAADDDLLETWLDTQPDDRDPRYWELPARQLSARIPDVVAVAQSMVGHALTVRGRHFGNIVTATGVPRASNDPARRRHAYDRLDLELDRDAPRATFFNFIAAPEVDYSVPSQASYVWAYLDHIRIVPVAPLRVWAEQIDYLSTDAFAVDVAELATADQQVELTLRVRHDDRITPYSPITIDGDRYNITSVEREFGAGRRRFLLLRCRRYVAAP